MADLENAIRKLATLDDTNPYERVYVIRQILDNVWRSGYEDGYRTSNSDRMVSDMLVDAHNRDAAQAERSRIADALESIVETREYRRRFEDRHAKHLGEGTTVIGVLAAVVDEIKGMVSRG